MSYRHDMSRARVMRAHTRTHAREPRPLQISKKSLHLQLHKREAGLLLGRSGSIIWIRPGLTGKSKKCERNE